ncbi:MAG: glycosyltransferase family 2 protein [bacterium]|nr:glycosyltransferase family 2 protein [bacterium]
MKDLSIIIVSWNVLDKLRECLRAIQPGGLDIEVFVVDNASRDESADMVRQEFPNVTVIANDANLGFAKANNQAIRESTGRYVLLLNPDMRPFPETFTGLVAWMDGHPQAGIVGIRLENQNGEIVPHVRRFPRFLDQFATLTKLGRLFPAVLDRYLMRDFDYSTEAQVDSIRGSFFAIRREVIDRIGSLDEDYFIWFEEVDFCKKATNAGFQVWYTPSVRCVDYVGQSFKQVRMFPKQKMFSKSMLTYFKKHRPWWEWSVLAIVRPFMLGLAKLHDVCRK